MPNSFRRRPELESHRYRLEERKQQNHAQTMRKGGREEGRRGGRGVGREERAR